MFAFSVRAVSLVALALAAFASPLSAKNWPNAGGWNIQEADTTSCAMFSEFEGKGDTDVVLSLQNDGQALLSLTNENWTSEANKIYELSYYVDGVGLSDVKSLGYENDGKKGFVALFGPTFLKHFAASTYLRIETKDGKVVDDLNVAGSAAALAQVRRCVAHLKLEAAAEARQEKAEERAEARFAHIADDPFADPKSRAPSGASAPRYEGNLTDILTSDDYPAAAMANNEQGDVRFRLTVGTDGRPTDCQVLQSSGSTALDESTCRIMRARPHFIPARSDKGDLIVGSVEDVAHWSLGQ